MKVKQTIPKQILVKFLFLPIKQEICSLEFLHIYTQKLTIVNCEKKVS